MKIAYLHGLESSINEKDPKIIFMRANFKEVYAPSINYRDEKTFDKLFSDIKRLKPDLIIGSSMGGYVSYLIGSKLGIETILFNPAVEDRSFDPVVDESGMKKSKHNVYLGKSDNVVSGKAVRNYFKKHAIGSFTYTEYEGGHRVPEDEFMGSIEQVTKIYKENINKYNNPKIMKKVQLFENYISEAAKFDVDVEEPFSERDEKKAISKFKIVAQPITILEVEGDIGENETAVEIKFSNDDVLQYTYSARNNRSPYKLKIISGNNGSDLNFSDEVEDYLGSTGSVIGDLGLLYKAFKAGDLQ